jgi:hypothetical protein
MKNGERDRHGHSSRRLAGWSSRLNAELNDSPGSRQNVSGQRPKTAGESPALPKTTASFRPGNFHLITRLLQEDKTKSPFRFCRKGPKVLN